MSAAHRECVCAASATRPRRARVHLALCAVLASLLPGVAGAIDCANYQDAVGATFKHTAARLAPCEGKTQQEPCRYYLNLTRPDGTMHTLEKPVDGCCVLETSGKLFCSSERSKSANPTALTVKQILNLRYECRGGRPTIQSSCDDFAPGQGFHTYCSEGLNERHCGCYLGTMLVPSPQGQCTCLLPNIGADCSMGGDDVCQASSRCVAFSSTMDEILTQGTELRFFDTEKQPDGTEVLRAKPSAWFGDEKAGTRPMSEHSWWWQTDAGGWEQFDEFNSASLEQAFSDDRQVTRLNFPGLPSGNVVANLGDMTMGEKATPDAERRQIRRQATTGQQHMPETLNGRIQTDSLADTEALRRASVLP